jgi:hypothetical protein
MTETMEADVELVATSIDGISDTTVRLAAAAAFRRVVGPSETASNALIDLRDEMRSGLVTANTQANQRWVVIDQRLSVMESAIHRLAKFPPMPAAPASKAMDRRRRK